MSLQDIFEAEAYAQSLSLKVHRTIREKLTDPNTVVVGAGSVFGYGIANMVGKMRFSRAELTTVAYGLSGKTDEDLGGGDYAFCEGTNILLALGFMRGLGIDQLQIINVNNADGAVLHRPFWQ
jgi:hypothetical protein